MVFTWSAFTGLEGLALDPFFSSDLFFIISFVLLGAGIKYIDDCFDEKVFSKVGGFLLAPILGLFWAFVMIQSPAAATILASIVIGVALKGKIDNLAFAAGTLVILFTAVLFGLARILWFPLIVISAAGLFDEILNDWSDKQQRLNRFVRLLFEYRFTMKLAVLSFAWLGTFPWAFFIAFLGFDIAYMLVYEYVKGIVHQRKFYYHEEPNGFIDKLIGAKNGKKR